jgi:hypothetical protein
MTFESYQSYSDYEKGKSKTGPNEMKKDATLTLKRLLPTFDEKWIDNVEDQSTDKGIKFQFKIGKDTVHMYKVTRWLGQWELYLNRKKISAPDLQDYLENNNLSSLDRFLKYAPSYDYNSQYIDDGGQYKKAESNNKYILNLFDELKPNDKKKAIKALKRNKGIDSKTIDSLFGNRV